MSEILPTFSLTTPYVKLCRYLVYWSAFEHRGNPRCQSLSHLLPTTRVNIPIRLMLIALTGVQCTHNICVTMNYYPWEVTMQHCGSYNISILFKGMLFRMLCWTYYINGVWQVVNVLTTTKIQCVQSTKTRPNLILISNHLTTVITYCYFFVLCEFIYLFS